MPELPEVETVMRGLVPAISGATIEKAFIYSSKIRIPVPENLARHLSGRRVEKLSRRAKYILIHLDNAHVLIIHLGMSGRMNVTDRHAVAMQKHDHLRLDFSNGRSVVFNDPRRFGLIDYAVEETLEEHEFFRHLGIEPLSSGFNAAYLAQSFSRRKTPVKIALMDQTLVVGVGNIYASEALFDAGIDPRRPANEIEVVALKKLAVSVRKVLRASIRAGGSTLRDYRQSDGELGYFQHRFSVYGKTGAACGHCVCDPAETGGVQKIVQGGRSSFYCPRKQV